MELDSKVVRNLKEIKAKRDEILEWLDKLEQKKDSVKPDVYQRVKLDYTGRLEDVNRRASELVPLVENEVSALERRREELSESEEKYRSEMEELELRRELGELSDDEFKEKSAAVTAKLEELSSERSEIEAAVEELSSLLTDVKEGGGYAVAEAERFGELESPEEPEEAETSTQEAEPTVEAEPEPGLGASVGEEAKQLEEPERFGEIEKPEEPEEPAKEEPVPEPAGEPEPETRKEFTGEEPEVEPSLREDVPAEAKQEAAAVKPSDVSTIGEILEEITEGEAKPEEPAPAAETPAEAAEEEPLDLASLAEEVTPPPEDVPTAEPEELVQPSLAASLSSVPGPKVVYSDGQREIAVSIDAKITVIGSSDEADVILPFSGVAARHAEIVRKRDRFILKDVSGGAGVYVGGQKVKGKIVLNHLDVIRVGSVELKVFLED